MTSPVRIPALGVDARSMSSSLDRSGRWEWTHPSLGLTIEVHADETRDRWIVVAWWKGFRIEEPDGVAFTLSDAYDGLVRHVQSYMPRLWTELRDLEGAEEMRVKCLRSQLEDERAEAMDEEACGA